MMHRALVTWHTQARILASVSKLHRPVAGAAAPPPAAAATNTCAAGGGSGATPAQPTAATVERHNPLGYLDPAAVQAKAQQLMQQLAATRAAAEADTTPEEPPQQTRQSQRKQAVKQHTSAAAQLPAQDALPQGRQQQVVCVAHEHGAAVHAAVACTKAGAAAGRSGQVLTPDSMQAGPPACPVAEQASPGVGRLHQQKQQAAAGGSVAAEAAVQHDAAAAAPDTTRDHDWPQRRLQLQRQIRAAQAEEARQAHEDARCDTRLQQVLMGHQLLLAAVHCTRALVWRSGLRPWLQLMAQRQQQLQVAQRLCQWRLLTDALLSFKRAVVCRCGLCRVASCGVAVAAGGVCCSTCPSPLPCCATPLQHTPSGAGAARASASWRMAS
jgi:hypothetical protein